MKNYNDDPRLRFVIRKVGEHTPAEQAYSGKILDSANSVVEFWREVVAVRPEHEEDKEHLIALQLDTKLRIKAYHVISVGTLNETLARPREILRPAILVSAFAFVLIHNHPSGDPSPSQADHRLTKTIGECAQIMEITLLDHVVIGAASNAHPPYFSFKEAGLL